MSETLGWVGIGVTLAGVVVSFLGWRIADFLVAVGATMIGFTFLLDRIDVRHVVSAVLCFLLALAVIAVAALKERRKKAEREHQGP